MFGEPWVRLINLEVKSFIPGCAVGTGGKLPVAGAYCGVDASAIQSPRSVVLSFATLPTTWDHGNIVVHR